MEETTDEDYAKYQDYAKYLNKVVFLHSKFYTVPPRQSPPLPLV